jgi:hypothetical protein
VVLTFISTEKELWRLAATACGWLPFLGYNLLPFPCTKVSPVVPIISQKCSKMKVLARYGAFLHKFMPFTNRERLIIIVG